jgi:hypothetical protein
MTRILGAIDGGLVQLTILKAEFSATGASCGSRIRRHEVETGFDADVQFIRPNNVDIISSIHQLNAKFKLWTTDCEFGAVKGAHAIVYILTIRDA